MYTVAQTEQTQSWLKRRPVRFVVATTNTAERTGQRERRDIQVAVCHLTTRCHRVPHTGPVVDSGCLRDRGEKHKGHQLYVVGVSTLKVVIRRYLTTFCPLEGHPYMSINLTSSYAS